MIVDLDPRCDVQAADLWVEAWRGVFPHIDFVARKPWLLNLLRQTRMQGGHVRAAYEKVHLLGFATIEPKTGLLEQICIAPAALGQGIAQALLDDIERLTEAPIWLRVNQDNSRAIRFYEKNRFVETGREINPSSGLPVLVMSRLAQSNR